MKKSSYLKRLTSVFLVFVLIFSSVPISSVSGTDDTPDGYGIGVINSLLSDSGSEVNRYRIKMYKNNDQTALTTIPDFEIPAERQEDTVYISEGIFSLDAGQTVELTSAPGFVEYIHNNQITRIEIEFIDTDVNGDQEFELYSMATGTDVVTSGKKVTYDIELLQEKLDPETGEPVLDEETGEPVMEEKPFDRGEFQLTEFTATVMTEFEVDVNWRDRNTDRPESPEIDENTGRLRRDENGNVISEIAFDIKADGSVVEPADQGFINNASNHQTYTYKLPKYKPAENASGKEEIEYTSEISAATVSTAASKDYKIVSGNDDTYTFVSLCEFNCNINWIQGDHSLIPQDIRKYIVDNFKLYDETDLDNQGNPREIVLYSVDGEGNYTYDYPISYNASTGVFTIGGLEEISDDSTARSYYLEKTGGHSVAIQGTDDYWSVTADNPGVHSDEIYRVYNEATLNNLLSGDEEVTVSVDWKDRANEAARKNNTDPGDLVLWRYVDNPDDPDSAKKIAEVDRVSLVEKDSNGNTVLGEDGKPVFISGYTFDDLEKYDKNGYRYVYYVKEKLRNLGGYEADYDNTGSDVSDRALDGGSITNRLSGTRAYKIEASWIAAAKQGGSAEATYVLQERITNDQGEYEWVNVKTEKLDQNGNIVYGANGKPVMVDNTVEITGFSAEQMTKNGEFAPVALYDENGDVKQYRVVQTHVQRTDSGVTGADERDLSANGEVILLLPNTTDQVLDRYQLTITDDGSGKVRFEYKLVGDIILAINKKWIKDGVDVSADFVNSSVNVLISQYKFGEGYDNYDSPAGYPSIVNGSLVLNSGHDGTWSTELRVPRYDALGHEYMYNVNEWTVFPHYEVEYEYSYDGQKYTYNINNYHVTDDGLEYIYVRKEWNDDNEVEYRKNIVVSTTSDVYEDPNDPANVVPENRRTTTLSDRNMWEGYVKAYRGYKAANNWNSGSFVPEHFLEYTVGDGASYIPASQFGVGNNIAKDWIKKILSSRTGDPNTVDASALNNTRFNNIAGLFHNNGHYYIVEQKRDGKYLTFVNTRVGVVNLELDFSWFTGDKDFDNVKVRVTGSDGFVHDFTITSQEELDQFYILNLPKYDSKGKIIEYSLSEIEIDGHSVSGGVCTITENGHTDICSVKVEEDQDGYQVGANNTDDVKMYKITNRFSSTTSFSFTKYWYDDSNAQDKRSSMYIQLMRKKSGSAWEDYGVADLWERDRITRWNHWTFDYNNLPRYDELGYEYTYSVSEGHISEYMTKAYSAYDPATKTGTAAGLSADNNQVLNGGTITDTLYGEMVISGHKMWNTPSQMASRHYPIAEIYLNRKDKYDEHGNLRPDSYTGERMSKTLLYNGDTRFIFTPGQDTTADYCVKNSNGTVKTVTDQNDENYGSVVLPRYDSDGVALKYELSEAVINGYVFRISGQQIINDYDGGRPVKVNVDKLWQNMDDQSIYPKVRIILHQVYDATEYDPVTGNIVSQTLVEHASYEKDFIKNEEMKKPANERYKYVFGETARENLREFAPNGTYFRYYITEELINYDGVSYTFRSNGDSGLGFVSDFDQPDVLTDNYQSGQQEISLDAEVTNAYRPDDSNYEGKLEINKHWNNHDGNGGNSLNTNDFGNVSDYIVTVSRKTKKIGKKDIFEINTYDSTAGKPTVTLMDNSFIVTVTEAMTHYGTAGSGYYETKLDFRKSAYSALDGNIEVVIRIYDQYKKVTVQNLAIYAQDATKYDYIITEKPIQAYITPTAESHQVMNAQNAAVFNLDNELKVFTLDLYKIFGREYDSGGSTAMEVISPEEYPQYFSDTAFVNTLSFTLERKEGDSGTFGEYRYAGTNTYKVAKGTNDSGQTIYRYSFTDLPKYSADGEIFYYRVKENNPPAGARYRRKYSSSAESVGGDQEVNVWYGLEEAGNKKNTYVCNVFEAKQIDVDKYWNDNNNCDGRRPGDLRVNITETIPLSGHDQTVNIPVVLLNGDGWTKKAALPRYYYNGADPISGLKYNISEEMSAGEDQENGLQAYNLTNEGYVLEETGYKSGGTDTAFSGTVTAKDIGDIDGLYLKNKRERFESELTVNKQWVGNDDQKWDVRPDELYVKVLYRLEELPSDEEENAPSQSGGNSGSGENAGSGQDAGSGELDLSQFDVLLYDNSGALIGDSNGVITLSGNDSYRLVLTGLPYGTSTWSENTGGAETISTAGEQANGIFRRYIYTVVECDQSGNIYKNETASDYYRTYTVPAGYSKDFAYNWSETIGAGGDKESAMALVNTGNVVSGAKVTSTVSNELKVFDHKLKKTWIDNNNEYRSRGADFTAYLIRRTDDVDTGTPAAPVNPTDENAVWHNLNDTTDPANSGLDPSKTSYAKQVITLSDSSSEYEFTFEDLPVYDKDGNKYHYQVIESKIGTYDVIRRTYNPTGSGGSVIKLGTFNYWVNYDSCTETETDISNEIIPRGDFIHIYGEKTWDDNNNQDGKRPGSLNYTLIQSCNHTVTQLDIDEGLYTADKLGQNVAEERSYQRTLNDDNNWKCEWLNCPAYTRDGEAYFYDVIENKLADSEAKPLNSIGYNTAASYPVKVSHTGLDGSVPVEIFSFTNRYVPRSKDLKAVKNWEDLSDAFSLRPAKVKLTLCCKYEQWEAYNVVLNAATMNEATDEELADNSVEKLTVERYRRVSGSGADYDGSVGLSAAMTAVLPAGYETEKILTDADKLKKIVGGVETEEDDPDRWGTVFSGLPVWINPTGKPLKSGHYVPVQYYVTEELLDENDNVLVSKKLDYNCDESSDSRYLLNGTAPADGQVTITNELNTRSVKAAKFWQDNDLDSSYGNSLHYNVDVTLSAPGLDCSISGKSSASGKYEETLTIPRDTSKGVEFIQLPVYSNGTKINYIIKETVSRNQGAISDSGLSEIDTTTQPADVAAGIFDSAGSTYQYGYSGSCQEITEDNITVQYDLTNTLPVAEFKVDLTWNDDSNRDGKRLSSADAVLWREAEVPASGEAWAVQTDPSDTKVIPLTESNKGSSTWRTSFGIHPQYNIYNRPYTYRVTELSRAKENASRTTVLLEEQDYTMQYSPGITMAGNSAPAVNSDSSELETNEVIDAAVATSFTQTDKEEAPGEKTTVVSFNVRNNYTPEKGDIRINKSWDDTGYSSYTRPAQMTFRLYCSGGGISRKLAHNASDILGGAAASVPETITVTSGEAWKKLIEDLPVNTNPTGTAVAAGSSGAITYYVVEDAHNAYTKSGDDTAIQLTDNTVTDTTITNTVKLRDLVVKKHWTDHGYTQLHYAVDTTVTLDYGDGNYTRTPVTIPKDSASGGTVTDLPLYTSDGQLAVYNVTESTFKYGYTANYSQCSGFSLNASGAAREVTVVNSLPVTNLDIHKTWDDLSNTYKLRPAASDLTFTLYRTTDTNPGASTVWEAVPMANVTRSISGWTYTYENLQQYDENGSPYLFKVAEDRTAANKNLAYEAAEPEITSYTTSVDYNVAFENKLITGKAEVFKYWNDNGNTDNIHYDISVSLESPANIRSDGGRISFTGRGISSASGSGNFVLIDNVPKYSMTGELISYSVTETPARYGYYPDSSSYSLSLDTKRTTGTTEYDYGSATITNILPVTEIVLNKTWSDDQDEYSLRPSQVSFTLERSTDGTSWSTVDTVVLRSSENWTKTISSLLKYDQSGTQYIYRLTESRTGLGAYGETSPQTTSVSDEDPNGNVSFTKSFANELITRSITVTKRWSDSDFGSSLRYVPAFTLSCGSLSSATNADASGKYLETKAVSGTADGASVTFDRLPKFAADGTIYDYHLEENVSGTQPVSANNQQFRLGSTRSGYTAACTAVTANDNTVTAFTVTNTLPLRRFTAVKTWTDDQNRDGVRPADLTFTLMRSSANVSLESAGTGTARREEDWVSGQDNGTSDVSWKVDMGYYPEYDPQNAPYDYYIQESVPGDYTSSDTDATDGDLTTYNFDNSRTSASANLSVSKIWNDTKGGTDYSGDTRPDEISVELYCKYSDEADTSFRRVAAQAEVNKWLASGYTYVKTLRSSDNWSPVSFDGLPVYVNPTGTNTRNGAVRTVVYTVRETTVLNGYTPQYGSTDLTGGDTGITVTNDLNVKDITIKKEWSDPDSLYGDTIPDKHYAVHIDLSSSDITAVNNVKYADIPVGNTAGAEITDIPLYDKNNAPVTYTVNETTRHYGYNASYDQVSFDPNDTDTVTVTNTLPTTSVTVTKTWQDRGSSFGNKDHRALRPQSIRLQLFRKAVNTPVSAADMDPDSGAWTAVGSGVTYTPADPAADTWTYTYSSLLKYDRDNKLYLFKIVEAPVNAYETTYNTQVTSESSTALGITNRLITKDITINKTWVDNGYGNSLHYDIPVRLKNASVASLDFTGTIPHGGSTPDTVTIEKVPVYDTNGNVISYTLTEETQKWGYELTNTATVNSTETIKGQQYVSAYTLTNELPLTTVRVEKNWLYTSSLDKYSSSTAGTVTVDLSRRSDRVHGDSSQGKADDQNFAQSSSALLSGSPVSFTKLLVYDEKNDVFTYSVTERMVTGFEASYSPAGGVEAEKGEAVSADETITVTNTEIKGSISIHKIDGTYEQTYSSEQGYHEITLPDAHFKLCLDSDQSKTAITVYKETGRSVYLVKSDTLPADMSAYEHEGAALREYTDLVTDSSGNITVKGLPLNRYRLVETAPPFGYKVTAPIEYVYDVDVDSSNAVIAPAVQTAKNWEDKNTVSLTKVDAADSKPLEKATYRLLRLIPQEIAGAGQSGKTPAQYRSDAVAAIRSSGGDLSSTSGIWTYWDSSFVVSGQTDVNGRYIASDLDFGLYFLFEEQAPVGYLTDYDDADLIIDISQENIRYLTGGSQNFYNFEVTHEDSRRPAELKISKEDEFGNPLNGAEFELWFRPGGDQPLTRPDVPGTVTPRSDHDYIYFVDGVVGTGDLCIPGTIESNAPFKNRFVKTNDNDNIYAYFYKDGYTPEQNAAAFGYYGQWPGVSVWERYLNENNEVVYKVEPPEGADRVIFHNNSGSRTVDIAFRIGAGYRKSTISSGKYTVTDMNLYHNDGVPSQDTSPTLSYRKTDKKLVITLDNNYDWDDLHIYFWNRDGGTDTPVGQPFPGYLMEDYGKSNGDSAYPRIARLQYSIVIPEGATHFQINNGTMLSDGRYKRYQSVDQQILDNPGQLYGGNFFHFGADSKDPADLSAFRLSQWDVVPAAIPAGANGELSDNDYIYFTDNEVNGSVWYNSSRHPRMYAYFYNDASDVYAAWPGIPADSSYKNESGETVSRFRYPTNYRYVIFNSGIYQRDETSSKECFQTEDIDLGSGGSGKGYYKTGKNGDKFTVADWDQSGSAATNSYTALSTEDPLDGYVYIVDSEQSYDDLHIRFFDNAGNDIQPSPGYIPEFVGTETSDGDTKGDWYRLRIPANAKELQINNGKHGNVVKASVRTELEPGGIYRTETTQTEGKYDLTKLYPLYPENTYKEGDIKIATLRTGDDGLTEQVLWNDPAYASVNGTAVSVTQWGTYYFKEVTTPVGYSADKDYLSTFVVDAEKADKTVNVIKAGNTRKLGSAVLKKISADQLGEDISIGQELPGVKFRLYAGSDTAGNTPLGVLKKSDGTGYTYIGGRNPIDITDISEYGGTYDHSSEGGTDQLTVYYDMVTGADGRIKIDGLDWGDYYFRESQAYSQQFRLSTEKISFTVGRNNCETEQELLCRNEVDMARLRINKYLDGDITDAWGEPTFIFRIRQTHDYAGNELTDKPERIVSLVLGRDSVTGETERTGRTDFIDIEPGTYEVTEVNVSRYGVDSCKFLEETLAGVSNQTITGNTTAKFDIAAGGAAEIKFTNSVRYYDKFSQTAGAVNVFNGNKDLIVEDPDRITQTSGTATINKSDLTAYLVKADGTRVQIAPADMSGVAISYTAEEKDDPRFADKFSDNGDTITVDNTELFIGGAYRLRAEYKGLKAEFILRFAQYEQVDVVEKKVVFRVDDENRSFFDESAVSDDPSRRGTAQYEFTYVMTGQAGSRSIKTIKHNGQTVTAADVTAIISNSGNKLLVNEVYSGGFSFAGWFSGSSAAVCADVQAEIDSFIQSDDPGLGFRAYLSSN